MSYPPEVEANLVFINTHNLWHIVSENPRVVSCPDAAQRRNRLGHEGIPLFDELKTNMGSCESIAGRRYVAAHCRGTQHLDYEKLSRALGGRFERVTDGELATVFGAEKGLVNPFSLASREDVQQIFDQTVLKPYFPPGTMMTNLGDFCIAVEFNVSQIIEALGNALVADIIDEPGKRVPTVHSLGILTGNGPESGMLLWQWINARIRNHPSRKILRNTPQGPREYTSKIFRGDISFPAVFIESLPGMGLSMELAQRESEVRHIVLNGVRRLCEQGATIVGIACNTTQYFADDVAYICEEYGAQFVRTADETARYLRREKIEAFDFLGIGAASDFRKWSGYGKALAEFKITTPSKEILARIDELAFLVKEEVVANRTINNFRTLINRETKTQVILLALTELSILFADQKKGQRSTKRFVDTLEILAERMADIYIQEYVNVDQPLYSEEEDNDAE